MQHAFHGWRRLARPGLWFACALAALSTAPSTARADDAVHAPIRLDVPLAPQPVASEGTLRLFHELHLLPASGHVPQPLRVTVRDADSGRELARYDGAALASRFAPWAPDGSTAANAGPPATQASVVYVELALPPGDLPRAITHDVEFDPADRDAGASTLRGGTITVTLPLAPTIGPPLRGGPWAAVFHPDWARGHRRVPYAVEGRSGIPGRFAVDWVKLDDDGRMAAGDPDRVRNAHAYGEEVLAVADGVVVATRDGFPESERISTHPRYRLHEASGNFVVLDIGDGRYAFYEHLRPGSLRVQPQQRVRRGEPIAQVGFSGSGNWPHLHFHVADAPSPLGAEGLPFALSRFRTVGTYEDIATLGKAPWVARADGSSAWRQAERPADNAVVWFADEEARGAMPGD